MTTAFRWLLAGRTITALGNAIAPVALAFAVLDLTGSAADLGLVVGARMLANVLFVLFGGALADRMPKHLLMVGASTAAALTQAVVAVLVLTGTATIPLLLGLSAVNGMVAALALPATSAVLPQIVPAEFRQRANGINRALFCGAHLVGAPVGGVLVAAVGPGWGIAVDAAAFLLAAVCFLLLRLPAVAAVEARHSILTDLRIGWSEFRARTWLWAVVAGFCLVNAALSGGMNVLGPTIADETVGRAAWGFVLAAQTGGMLLGALLAMRVRFERLLFYGVLNVAAIALPLLALGLAPRLWLLLAATFLAGFCIEQFAVAWETSMQEHVPGDKLARVYSYDMIGSFVAIPIGQVAAGPIAEALGTGPTLTGAAILVLLATGGMLTSRDVRHLRHRPVTKPMEESLP